MNITPLHLETSYSMRGSNLEIDALILDAKKLGYNTLAITDHRMYGVVSFYKACQKQGVKPILGAHLILEGIVTEQLNHIFVYAKTNDGYVNLLKLISYYALNDKISVEDLKQYHHDCVIVFDTDNSEYKSFVLNQKTNELHTVFELWQEHTVDLYMSISKNDDVNQTLSKQYKMLALSRVLYHKKTDKEVRKTLQKIFSIEAELFDENHHLISKNDLETQFSSYPDALKNVENIINKCQVTLDFDTEHLPTYPHDKTSSKAYLKALVYAGLKKRLTHITHNHKQYYARVDYELNVINQMGYNDYFLIVWDFVKYAKKQDYLVGPGRGSAAASLVSYCLGITSIDSIKYDLVFERFLNPERITLPDIDIDLPDDKRDDVIGYVRDLYGLNKVASICTFGRFKIKSAIRDTARVHGESGVLVNQIIKETKGYESVKEMVLGSKKITTIINNHPQFKLILDTASAIEELPKHVSTHAAGIIIADDVLTRYTPLQSGLLGMMQTQYEAKDLENLGLLKIDFLGLRNLSIVKNTTNLIQEDTNKTINMYKIPLDDKKTIQLLNNADTTGIFQLESDGMRQLIKNMDMQSFDDIVTVLALYRPGPMESIPSFLRRRFKKEKVTFLHPSLQPILEPTNGIIIYQEQIIKIANIFAGYSLGEADLLRRAVSKKQHEVLTKERTHFIEKAKAKGHEEALSNEIYDYIVKFANYGFNKAHSVAYARVSYWMAYLKANYPKYFIGVLMNSVIGSESSLRLYIYEAFKLGLEIYKPSVNQSQAGFLPYKDGLIYPLLGIKNVGRNSVEGLLKERENGQFKSFVEFVSRAIKVVNKRVIESLILAGACDEFNHTKQAMITQLGDILGFSDYGAFIDQEEFVLNHVEEYEFTELMANEKTILGFNLFTHPLQDFKETIKKNHIYTPKQVSKEDAGNDVRLIGVLSRIKEITTKKGDDMAFITIEDEVTQLDGVVFPKTFKQIRKTLTINQVYLFLGKIELRNEQLQYIIQKVHLMER